MTKVPHSKFDTFHDKIHTFVGGLDPISYGATGEKSNFLRISANPLNPHSIENFTKYGLESKRKRKPKAKVAHKEPKKVKLEIQ